MKKTARYFFIHLLMGATVVAGASKIEKGFAALQVHDYFSAMKIFKSITDKKQDAYARYGMALIYSRNNNPFYNLDSACLQVTKGYNAYLEKKIPAQFGPIKIDSVAIISLAQQVALVKFEEVKKAGNPEQLDNFLYHYYLASRSVITEAISLRDELEFDLAMQQNKSAVTGQFLLTHPGSRFYKEAQLLADRQVYEELTRDKKASSYIAFLNSHPNNAMLNSAYEQLFSIYKKNADVKGLSDFVKVYPSAPQNLDAWKLLFSLSVKAYSFAELKKFLDEYPEFPLKNTILKDLELNKVTLFPYKNGEYTGFIDNKGKIVIPTIYDEAAPFNEGLAVVHRNDSVYFINKENTNPFGRAFTEAWAFRNGKAPVQTRGRWHFINRLGQVVSKDYDEISELSDGVYVVKIGGKYGALDQFAQPLIEPRHDKLGDFKNGFAYYVENGKYGFVSKTGTSSKAEFEWISDFTENHCAVIRQQGKYGLINATGKMLAEPVHDQIWKAANGIFILVQNGFYGFYSAEGCPLSMVIYDFVREQPTDYYTDGRLFKLLRKKEQAMMDSNGALVSAYGQFDELGFPGSGLMLARRKKKYGYVDRRLSIQIPFKYDAAASFQDSVAVVSVAKQVMIIDTKGQEVFSSSFQLRKLSRRYYLLSDERRSIINSKGEVVASGVAEIQENAINPLIITLSSGEIRLLYD